MIRNPAVRKPRPARRLRAVRNPDRPEGPARPESPARPENPTVSDPWNGRRVERPGAGSTTPTWNMEPNLAVWDNTKR
ncbi:hypothetical protein GCM10027187_69320 [Streptosporangium sandarakinum]